MALAHSLVISFKDIQASKRVQEMIESRCEQLWEEFPEARKFEFTIAPEGDGHRCHCHVTGKKTEVATHAIGGQMGDAANQLLDKLERQLRKTHDKSVKGPRRIARRTCLKKVPVEA